MLVPTLLVSSLVAPLDHGGGPIDFAKIPRELEAEPEYVGEPRYGLFLLGKEGEHRVWAVLDKSDAKQAHYDVLYLDRDADGELGEPGERVEAEISKARGGTLSSRFDIGDLAHPGSERVHTDFVLTWTEASVRFQMKWDGETKTMGGYGPTRDTYASFGESAEEATVYVPGYDRPLEFEHWMSGRLTIGRADTFKVFLGARGSQRGAFSCGDQELLPDGEYVVATLHYTDVEDEERTVLYKLRERC